ncbi:MAG: SusC/RagA family TonB-linked outer membrane protein [Chitinophagaceae bacterium]|nr:MAG: SusC/RagA family TonB-linked outer membrane protein [Chitinophagaceae bacterium]
MRKSLTLLAVLVFCSVLAFAQVRVISGLVSSAPGTPLPFASVTIKGTTKGTTTDANGNFKLEAQKGDVLVISAVGTKSTEITVGDNNTYSVTLEASGDLSEVIVTALGIKRDVRSVGYAVQSVSAEDLTFSKSVDVSASLAGKVAGVKLVGSPSSTYDNATITIRGINGLGVTNPIYVVDGTITDQSNVDMDNVENISVLKGPAATALYGQRALNGAVLVTTKKGSRKGRTNVEFNLGAAMENVSIIPKYQNSYAGGYSYTAPVFEFDPTIHPAEWASFDGQNILDYGADESWGPPIDGRQYRSWSSWYPGEKFGQLSTLTPQPNNVKDYFNTGVNLNNSVAVSGGGENYNFRLSYANQYRTLVLPNTNRERHQIGLSGTFDVSRKISVVTDIAYTITNTKGQPYEEYRNDGLNVTQGFNQWFQRQLDMNEMKQYRQPDGRVNSWNIGDPNSTGNIDDIVQPQYWDNPYFISSENYQTNNLNRLVGNIGFIYKINDNFRWETRIRRDFRNDKGDNRIATGGLQLDAFGLSQRIFSEMNYESILYFNEKVKDFSFDAFLGGNIRKLKDEGMSMSTAGGLTFPNYFNIAGSVSRPNTANTFREIITRSIFGKVGVGYKNFAFLEGTLRYDASSTLPIANNSYYYPSITGSLVLSDLYKGELRNIVSFAKVRAAYATAATDLGFNEVNVLLNNGSLYQGNASLEISNSYRSGAIRPALVKTYEFGADVRFLNNRIGLDFAYYVNNNTDQIINLTVAPASGFSSAQINAGNIRSKGWELSLTGTPVQTKDFKWEVSVNLSRNRSTVVELAEGLTNVIYGTTWNNTSINNRVGKDWGIFVSRKYRRFQAKDGSGNNIENENNGKVLVGNNGIPLFDQNQEFGSMLPDYTGGAYSTLSYKGISLSFSLDFQSGGLFYSSTKMFNLGTGLSEYTVGVNDKGNDWRLPVAQGGGILFPNSVKADGSANTTYINARNYFYTSLQNGGGEEFILDASYLKLREVRLGYDLPARLFGGKSVFKGMNIALTASNPWLIAAPSKKYGIDASELEVIWNEGGQLSAVRGFGINIRTRL